MKFLVIASFKDTTLSVSPSVIRKALEASLDALNQDRKAGKILEMYWVPGWGRAVSIQERASAEELTEHFNKQPIAAAINFEIYPLADAEVWTKGFIEYLKEAEKLASSSK